MRTITIRSRTAAVVAVAALILVGGTLAYGAAADPPDVMCTSSPCTVTVTLPTPTVTETVTGPTTTVTETVTAPPTTTTQPPTTTTAPPTTATTTTVTPPPTTTTTTAPPVSCPVTGTNKPGASDGKGGCFPGPGNTGVPAGQSLTAWTSSNTFGTANLTVMNRTFTGRVTVTAANVSLVNSRLLGGLTVTGSGSVHVTDSYIASGDGLDKAADLKNATTLRTEINGTGGNSGGWCATNCQMTDSWMHISTRRNATDHNSGWRMRQNSTLTHNTIACEVPSTGSGGGCSAALTGYGDFETVINNTMQGNLFVASTQQSFCAYGGSSAGKPYTSGAHDNKFLSNTFQRGTNGRCGAYDPIGDYDLTKTGNTMTGNVWDDGSAVTTADVN